MKHSFFEFVDTFFQASFGMQWDTILMALSLISIILVFSVGAFIWTFLVIPKIEKRMGETLECSIITDTYLFGNFFMFQVELSAYILRKYALLKLGKDPDKRRLNKYAFGLARVNYDIRQASCLEISMSFFTVGGLIFSVLCLIVAFFIF